MTARCPQTIDALPPLAYQQPGNRCRRCSPTGRAIGEPGCECDGCGTPIETNSLELAETRAARLALKMITGGERP